MAKEINGQGQNYKNNGHNIQFTTSTKITYPNGITIETTSNGMAYQYTPDDLQKLVFPIQGNTHLKINGIQQNQQLELPINDNNDVEEYKVQKIINENIKGQKAIKLPEFEEFERMTTMDKIDVVVKTLRERLEFANYKGSEGNVLYKGLYKTINNKLGGRIKQSEVKKAFLKESEVKYSIKQKYPTNNSVQMNVGALIYNYEILNLKQLYTILQKYTFEPKN